MSCPAPRTASRAPALVVRAGVLPGCAGSSCVEVGETRVFCAVRGPLPMQEYRGGSGALRCVVNRAPFTRPLPLFAGAREGPEGGGLGPAASLSSACFDLERTLQAVLEGVVCLDSFPMLLYEVVVEIVSSDGAELSACIAAASVALASAAVDMVDIASAATVGLCGSVREGDSSASGGGGFVVHPSGAERRSLVAVANIVSTVHSRQLCHVSHTGAVAPETLREMTALGLEACAAQHGVFVAALS